MTNILSVKARTVVLGLDAPVAFATRQVLARQYVLVQLEASDGETGIGFCYAGTLGGSVVTEAVRTLAPLLVGEDVHGTEGLWEQMYRATLLLGRGGAMMRAMSAIDCACWDHNSRVAGLPLYRYLGSATKRSVPVYASGGYFASGKSPRALADEVAGYIADGHTAVKIKVGREGLHGEEARVAAVRDRIGGDVALMLDANNAFTDLATASRFTRMYESYDPYWIEEPFSPDDVGNHARLAETTHVPLATGEIEAGRWRFKELLERQAATILQPDAAVCGGITEWRRIAALASAFSVSVAPHWFHDLHVHLVASTPNAHSVEYFPDTKVFNFSRLIDNQLVVENGQALLSDRPGLGFCFLSEAVNRYAIDSWA